jgi:hypothetical protein
MGRHTDKGDLISLTFLFKASRLKIHLHSLLHRLHTEYRKLTIQKKNYYNYHVTSLLKTHSVYSRCCLLNILSVLPAVTCQNLVFLRYSEGYWRKIFPPATFCMLQAYGHLHMLVPNIMWTFIYWCFCIMHCNFIDIYWKQGHYSVLWIQVCKIWFLEVKSVNYDY